MKKLFKVLFGRTVIVGLSIILQILFVYTMIVILEEFIVLFRIINLTVSIIALISLINRDMLPEGKLTWSIIIMVLQFMGVFLYLMFSRNVLSRRQYKLLKRIDVETCMTMKDDMPIEKQLQQEMGSWYGVGKHLTITSKVTMHQNTYSQFFSDGESFWQDMLSELSKAQRFIFMEYFIIEKGKMWDSVLNILKEKVNQGIEVRIMYDDMGCISKLPSNYYKKLKKMGIQCIRFNAFRPIMSAVHNNRDHRKITVIDGRVGYMGGINLADEYINHTHPYGYWKDTAVKLKGEAVKNLTLMFLQLYNAHTKIVDNFDNYLAEEKYSLNNQGVVVPFGDGPKPHYTEQVAEQAYLNIINCATQSICITTPYLIPTYRLQRALIDAVRRGVDVSIITPHIPDKKFIFMITRYNYGKLREAGVKIYEYTPGFIHSKTIIADNIAGIVGTINMDYRSLIHHYECGVFMYKTQAIKQLSQDINKTISESQLIKHQPINLFQRMVCKVTMLFTPLL